MATAKKAAKKSPAKKAPAKKAVAKKTAAKKTAADNASLKERVEQLVEDVKARAKDAQENGQKASLATLGLYGKAYDVVAEKLEEANGKRDEQMNELVSRGEAVRNDIKARFEKIEVPSMDLDSVKESFQKQVDSLKDSAEDMREKMNESFDNLKEKVAPAKA